MPPKAYFHVPFRYTSDGALRAAIEAEGYDLDGIEGYVYDPGTAQSPTTQPAGTQMLCSRRNFARHDRILVFDPAGTCGAQSPSGDPHASGYDGTGYNNGGGAGEKIGWAYPVQQPKALPDLPKIAAQSVDGDQYADIVWRYDNASTIVIYTQQGYQTITYTQLTQSMSQDWKLTAVADFNGDGNADLLWIGRPATSEAGKVQIWSLAGSQVVSFASFTHATNFEFAGVGDFDGDARADILWRETGATGQKYLAIWFIDGSIQKPASGLVPQTMDASWKVRGVADLNNDGIADIVFRQAGTGAAGKDKLQSWLMNSKTITAYFNLPDAPGDTVIKGVADVSGDGHADIVFLDNAGNVGVWLIQNGNFHSGKYIAYSIPSEWSIVGLRDFDGDGKSDILWRHTSGLNAAWMLDGLSIKGSGYLSTVPPAWKAQPETP